MHLCPSVVPPVLVTPPTPLLPLLLPDNHSTVRGRDQVIFEVTQEEDGGFVAACVTAPIFTQADSWAELREQMQDAVRTHCFDRPIPPQVRLHFVRDELLKISRRDTKARREGSTPLDDLELGKPGSQETKRSTTHFPGFLASRVKRSSLQRPGSTSSVTSCSSSRASLVPPAVEDGCILPPPAIGLRGSHTVLLDYLHAALRHAHYDILPEDQTFYGEIPECQGVYANATTLEACRTELGEVLEEWVLFRVSRNLPLPLPILDGIELAIRDVA